MGTVAAIPRRVALLGLLSLAPAAWGQAAPAVVLNEIDCDQPGHDAAEFVELHAPGGTSLDGVFLLLFDGSDGATYEVIDLYGERTEDDGLLVVGSSRVPGVDVVAFSTHGLQNGSDGAALYWSPLSLAADFNDLRPDELPADAVQLDALVWGTDADGARLAAALGCPAVPDEDRDDRAQEHALHRLPDGGAPRDAALWVAGEPTPGRLNGHPLRVAIHDIQGRAHVSPLRGRFVADVEGVVTSRIRGRFSLQQAPGTEDDDPATSEAIWVDAGRARVPAVGDRVRVTGRVEEQRPGGIEGNLSTTRLSLTQPWELVTSGHPLPTPVEIGPRGRQSPRRIVDDDTRDGDVEAGRTQFDPRDDGLDFWESVEAMRISLDGAHAVGPTSRFGEIPVVPADAEELTPRGLALLTRDDGRPERILVDDAIVRTPQVDAGDRFGGPLVGVVDYSYGIFKLLLTEPVSRVAADALEERAPEAPADALVVASYNVENLSARSDPARFAALAEHIVEALRAPHIVALQEIQDDSGPVDDGTVTAHQTLGTLVAAIEAAGGPRYETLEVAPADGADGGQPGGNIRVALLYRTDDGLGFRPRPGARADLGTELLREENGTVTTLNPGRIDPAHPAWDGGRKPLVATFDWRGEPLVLIDLHLKSKGGDSPHFGRFQPPVRGSEAVRGSQAAVVAEFTAQLLEAEPQASILVLGDLNDWPWSAPVRRLGAAGGLTSLVPRAQPADRYSYIYQGVAQVLDHALVSPGLLERSREVLVDFVHLNAHRVDGASDHDPLWLAFAPR